ncbi:MAG: tetratricopeptide repeat protein [Candidatus Marinimicrobia bacterium]|nr:tetratricopeptide repeat protein [Candidatus Neomarinimicrobiota bacterium]
MKKILLTALAGAALVIGLACESQEFVSAKMYVQQNDLDQAEKFFLLALDVPAEAQNALIPYLLASQVYAPQRRYEEMAEMLDEALRRNPAQKHQGFTIDELVTNTRQVEWSAEYQRGTTIYNEVSDGSSGGELTDDQKAALVKSLAHFKTAIMIWPEDEKAYTNTVYCYRLLGDAENESKSLSLALERNPDDGYVLLLAGEHASKNDNLESAVDYYTRAHKALPDNLAAMQRLTGIYLELDQPENALVILEETQKHSPRDPDVYYNIGAVYSKIGDQALKKGQEIYRQAAAEGNVTAQQLELALEQFKQAQTSYSEALYFLDNTLILNPDDAVAQESLRKIQATKKILDTMQRSTEEMLRQ